MDYAKKVKVLYEDKLLMVVYKPAGLAVQTSSVGKQDLVSILKNRMAGKEDYLAVIHRLDQPVEGLLVFAKDKKTAAALNKMLHEGKLVKSYIAVCKKQPEAQEGTLIDYMIKDGQVARIVPETEQGSVPAKLRYTRLADAGDSSLFSVEIETGRFHQIRAQMAHAGMALLGDRKYADEETQALSMRMGIQNVALCAGYLGFEHPTKKDWVEVKVVPRGEAFQPYEEVLAIFYGRKRDEFGQ